MDKITIDNKDYDPYFILDVSINDSDEHISQAFIKKAKKYHPDRVSKELREKYTRYFNVIRECYEYIKLKRKEQISLIKRKERKKAIKIDETQFTKEDLHNFNNEFEKEIGNAHPNNFGYGKQQRIQSIKDYEDQQIEIVNQFDKKKYTNEEFNLLFEYTKQLNEQKEPTSKALIHKTSDGFFGYNTSDLSSCSMVSSFNGLLITGDNFGESGVGYWSNNYGDYKQSFDTSKNPQHKIRVPESFKQSSNKPIDPSQYKKQYESFTPVPSGNYNAEQEKLFRTTLDQLMEKEEADKQMFMKYKNQYDENTIQQALDGRLETSPTLLQNLGGHYKQLRMG